jgi:hypothetical protein
MKSIEQLRQAVEGAREAHTAAMGRLLAAEQKHDDARFAFTREKWRKRVLECITEVRATEDFYRGAQRDLALLTWDEAIRDARRLHEKAQRAAELRKPPEQINEAWQAHEEALAMVQRAAAAVDLWRPVQ